jgi:hypothetical protein
MVRLPSLGVHDPRAEVRIIDYTYDFGDCWEHRLSYRCPRRRTSHLLSARRIAAEVLEMLVAHQLLFPIKPVSFAFRKQYPRSAHVCFYALSVNSRSTSVLSRIFTNLKNSVHTSQIRGTARHSQCYDCRSNWASYLCAGRGCENEAIHFIATFDVQPMSWRIHDDGWGRRQSRRVESRRLCCV